MLEKVTVFNRVILKLAQRDIFFFYQCIIFKKILGH